MEPPVYRPFALLAFAAMLGVGTPLGVAMLAWLYLGGPAVRMELVLLHAHVQIFGFFATLIPGVAPHLLARFTGRPLAPHPVHAGLAAALGAALALRVAGAAADLPLAVLTAALLQAVAFGLFGLRVWRALDPPPLAPLRLHLTLATAWLAAGCAVEAGLRATALAAGLALPDVGALRAVNAMGIFGGIVGWILGVLLRAGPMFVADWRLPGALVRAVPLLLAGAVVLAVVGEAGALESGEIAARAGDALALVTIGAVMAAGGAFRRPGPSLPMLSRSPAEARLFRLAAGAVPVAVAGAALATALAARGEPTRVVADAVRHLLTVGVLTTVVVAMAFRLIPVLEGRPLLWPAARAAAFWLLLAAVVLRSGEVLVSAGLVALAPAVALSGVLAWLAVAGVAANLVAAILSAPRREHPPRATPPGRA